MQTVCREEGVDPSGRAKLRYQGYNTYHQRKLMVMGREGGAAFGRRGVTAEEGTQARVPAAVCT